MQRPGQPLISGTGRRRASAPYSVRPQTTVLHIHRRVASTRGSRCLEAVSTNCSRSGASHHQPSFCRHAPQTLVLNHQPLIDPFRSPRALFCSSIRLPARSSSKSQYSLHRHSAPTIPLLSSTATPSLHLAWPSQISFRQGCLSNNRLCLACGVSFYFIPTVPVPVPLPDPDRCRTLFFAIVNPHLSPTVFRANRQRP